MTNKFKKQGRISKNSATFQKSNYIYKIGSTKMRRKITQQKKMWNDND